jgi:REP element-mobilizing transposase RayT
MSVHKPITEPGIYFITFTCHQWLQLIEITKGYDLVYNWFDILKTKSHTITGYVIMPNHLHLLLHFTGGKQSLNTYIGNGKRFMAYEIINRLDQQNEISLLNKLKQDVQKKDKSRDKNHEVWINSFDVKECRTEKFILQKLHYIHNNPCTDKWKLADSSIHYIHSSASFYISGRHGGYVVRDYREFISEELWKE